MKKPLQPHLLKRVPPACKGERTMKWRGRPPIGGQDSDRVSHRCFAPYTLLPLRGISPQGETRNLRRKTESHILHVPLRHSPFGGWRHHLSAPLGSVSLDSQSPTAPCESSSLATASGDTIKRRYAVSCLRREASRCFIVPPLSGGKVVP